MKLFLKSIILTAVVLLPLSNAFASHYSAGELFYQWIGNEPGKGPNDYRVFATIYRNTNGVAIGTGNLNGCAFRTSGGASISITLNYITPGAPLPPRYRMTPTNPYGWVNSGAHPNDPNGWDIPAFDVCATSAKSISEYRYVGEVTLTGKAADWRFAVFPPCCRDGNDNLASSGNLYLEVQLNNRIGPNSSPRIITPASKAFCVVQPNQKAFDWAQTAAEVDGDSLLYGFDPGGSQSGSTCNSGTALGYISPFTASDPFPSNPRVRIDQNLGVFTMSPSSAGSYVVKFEVREFRFDTTSLQWLVNGNTVREVQIQIAAACKLSTQNGPQLDPANPNTRVLRYSATERDSMKSSYNVANLLGADSLNNNTAILIPFYDGYTCFDNEVIVDFDVPIKCKTVTPTDFRLIGPDGIARPIVDIETNCQVDLVTRKLTLKLFRPLDKNGNYLLQVRRGHDGNTLENECGFEIREFYSALIEVKDCPGPEYAIRNVTVAKDQFPVVSWGVNDTSSTYFTSDTNTPKFFNYWSILRRDQEQGGPLIEAGRVDSFAGRSFTDSFPDDWQVDLVIWDYQVRLVTNGLPKDTTRILNTIRLQDSLADDVTQLQLYWNHYNGWDTSVVPTYKVYDTKIDTTLVGAQNWTLVQDVSVDTNFLYQKPPQDSLNEGLYAVRVETEDPNSALVSTSNWIYYQLLWEPDSVPPPPPPIPELGEILIPNIITPNGDDINDRFYVSFMPEGSRSYEQISVQFFNRWGQLVFEDANFHLRNTPEAGWDGTDMNSGNSLGNGVYYYLININDPASGEQESLQGHITITSANITN